jgi:Zn-dependent alcohol dehydrogenase
MEGMPLSPRSRCKRFVKPSRGQIYPNGRPPKAPFEWRVNRLEQVNEGYHDLLAGKNIRGVIIHES